MIMIYVFLKLKKKIETLKLHVYGFGNLIQGIQFFTISSSSTNYNDILETWRFLTWSQLKD